MRGMTLAVIPARGGSRRLPRKNVRAFCGRPMIAWSIETARASGLFDRVIVSTDDAEIAATAEREGAECPFVRPAALANDHATTVEVLAHATGWGIAQGWTLEAVCAIYATAPFIAADDLARGATALESGAWSYAIAATTFAAPIFRSFRQREGGGVEMLFPEHFTTRSQDLPPVLHDAGQFYWGRPAAWLECRPVFDRWTTPVMIPRWRVQDIDDADDWTRAEMMFAQVKGRQS